MSGPTTTTTGGVTAPRRVPPADAGPALTPNQRLVESLISRNVSVSVTKSDGTNVTLTEEQLRAFAADPTTLTRDGFALDTNDVLSAMRNAVGRNMRNAPLDLTRATELRLYNGADDVAADARPFAPRAEVTIGTDGAFDISGDAIHQEREVPSFWVSLLEAFAELFTGFAYDSRTWNGRLSSGEEQRVHRAAAGIVLAGGSAFRHEYLSLSPEQAKARFVEQIFAANPALNRSNDTDLGYARHLAASFDTHLRGIYTGIGAIDAPPSEARAARRLDMLTEAYATTGTFALDRAPDAWLLRHLDVPADPAAASTTRAERLRADLRTTSTVAEVQASLALASPEFIALDPPSQRLVAQRLLEARHDSRAAAEMLALLRAPAFTALSPAARRSLLDGVDRHGSSAHTIEAARRLIEGVASRSEAVRTAACELFANLPRSGTAPDDAAQGAADLLSAPAFARMQEGVVPRAPVLSDALVITLLQQARGAAVGTHALNILVQNPAFQRLAASDATAAGNVVRDLAAAPAASRAAAEDAAGLFGTPASLTPQLQRDAFNALLSTRAADTRAALTRLLGSRGFALLPQAQQSALIAGYQAATTADDRRAYGLIADMLETLVSGAPPTLSPLAVPAVNALAGRRAAVITAGTTELARLLPALGGLDAGVQAALIASLNQGGFDASRAVALTALAQNEGFRNLSPRPQAQLDAVRTLQTADARVFRRALETVLRATLTAAAPPEATCTAIDALVATPGYAAPRDAHGALSADDASALRSAILSQIARADTTVAQVQAVQALIAAPEFQALSLAQKREALALCYAHPDQQAQIVQAISAYALIGTAAKAEFFAALTRAMGTSPSTLAPLVSVVSQATFVSLDPDVQARALQAFTRGDASILTRVQTAMAAPSFSAASGAARSVAVQAALLDRPALTTSAGFTALPPDAQAALLASILRAEPSARAAVMTSAQALLASAGFGALSGAERSALLRGLEAHGLDAAMLDRATALFASPGWAALPAAAKTQILNTIAAAPTTQLIDGLNGLISDAQVRSLPQATQLSLVAQATQSPNPEAIGLLTRVAGAGWFRAMTHADQQRAAALMAYDGTAIHTSTNDEQRAILTHSVAQFLPPTGAFRLSFRVIPSAPGTVTWGEAGGGLLTLNSTFIPASDVALPPSTNLNKVCLDTMAHEVNHLMNTDEVRPTYDYFMGEYRAWYVGELARTGRPPSAAACHARAQYLLSTTTGAYASINQALTSQTNGRPSAEAQRIIRFMSEFYPTPLDPNDNASVSTILTGAFTSTDTFPDGGPRPNPIGNFTNAGTAVITRGGGAHAEHMHTYLDHGDTPQHVETPASH